MLPYSFFSFHLQNRDRITMSICTLFCAVGFLGLILRPLKENLHSHPITGTIPLCLNSFFFSWLLITKKATSSLPDFSNEIIELDDNETLHSNLKINEKTDDVKMSSDLKVAIDDIDHAIPYHASASKPTFETNDKGIDNSRLTFQYFSSSFILFLLRPIVSIIHML